MNRQFHVEKCHLYLFMFKIICVLVHSCIDSFWLHFLCFFLLMKKNAETKKNGLLLISGKS